MTSRTKLDEKTDRILSTITPDAVITPWSVSSSPVDYLRLVDQFGAQVLDSHLLERWERVTGVEMHLWMKRGIFFSHRRIETILDAYEAGKPIYLYTGRGPSSGSLHLGHLIPFLFTKYLQDALRCPVVIQISDDEKYLFKTEEDRSLAEYQALGRENIKDILACGFDPERTLIFLNSEFFGGALYQMCCRIERRTSGLQIRSCFGLDLENNLGQIGWPAKQIAPAFSGSFPGLFGEQKDRDPHGILCLVPYAIDQDPYFRLARSFAGRHEGIEFLKPCSIMCKFLPGLDGQGGKMSSSAPRSTAPRSREKERETKTDSGKTGNSTRASHTDAIFLDSTPEEIRAAIQGAFSGCLGDGSMRDHRKYGGDLSRDVAYQYLLYFEPDDVHLAELARDFTAGRIGSSVLKRHATEVLTQVVQKHQVARSQIISSQLVSQGNSSSSRLGPEIPKSRLRDEENRTEENRDRPFLRSREEYSRLGLNFDPTFGAQRPSQGQRPSG